MSIASDLRSYADSAVAQSRQVIDQTVSTAQAQINEVSDQANDLVENLTATARENFSDFAGKANDVATDLRSSAENVINFDALMSAIEPYLAQAKGYGNQVSERAEVLIDNLRSDKRVAKFLDSAESVSGVVIETVQERVVKPVQNLAGRGTTPAAKPTARKPSTAKARPSARKPATTKSSTTKSSATKSSATKPATTRKASPRKAAPKA